MNTDTPPPRHGAAGGNARAAKLAPDRRATIARSGAAAVNSPAALARRIVRAWPLLTRAERTEVRAILAAVAPRSRPSRGEQ
jgi:hypothetical protein